jgi:hypothetical protein
LGQVKTNSELKKLINESFGYFPKVKEVENTVNIATENFQSVSLSKNPDIKFNTGYNYIMPEISFPINGKEIMFQPVNNVAASVGSNYTLFDFGKLKASVEKSKLGIKIAKENTALVKSGLANQIAAVYYNIVYFQKAIALQDSLIQFYLSSKQLAENKLKNGEALQLDILSLQANIDAEKNNKIDLESGLKKQQNLLNYITGTEKIGGKEFDFDIESIDVETGISIAQQNNPVFKIAGDQITQSKNEIDIIKLQNKPNIAVNAATGIRNGYVPDVNELRFNYMAGISFVFPIYSFGKTKQQIKLQETYVKQNELSKMSLASSYKKDIEQAKVDVNNNTEKIKNVSSQIDAASMARKITFSRYQNGVATYLDVMAAATQVQKATLAQLQYQYQLCVSKITLANLLGYEYWNN